MNNYCLSYSFAEYLPQPIFSMFSWLNGNNPKQKDQDDLTIDRGYDFSGVLEWFAERVDRIILLFDAHKLDISDEFKRCIEALSGNEDKIRIVLNKSDMVDHQQLMRVYGALMWSLGKVFKTPEVARVYISTFWDNPLHYDINRRLFQDEKHDLFGDLQSLPRNAALRKLNDLIKRARLAKVHAYIIAELRKQMPSMIGKEKKKKELIQKLDKIFDQLQKEHNISPGDFPDVNKMREHLQNADFQKFNAIKPRLLEVVDNMLATDIGLIEDTTFLVFLNGNEDKIRIVLNKSDMVDHQQLMRVYGALMWSLGKVFKTPEVARVYISTFWDNPLHYDINRRLFQDEKHDLFGDLQSLPRNAALRKLNDLIKRARLAKVHAYIIAELRKQMPSMIGKEKKKKELIQKLDKIFDQLQKEHNISPGDFPDVNKMREHLQNADFQKFNAIKPRLLEVVDNMLATDIGLIEDTTFLVFLNGLQNA
ncbi:EH domain-containing protein 1 [Ditylenchus destructor]|uniref:EH domain-containing protein 1 n=1 Tax=Ditylenchus destructor TaxID=166010 RepID=A0AAD4NDR4_9BILA|nr:EH domain-containing protein 1 [Ditylenchus destructor]